MDDRNIQELNLDNMENVSGGSYEDFWCDCFPGGKKGPHKWQPVSLQEGDTDKHAKVRDERCIYCGRTRKGFIQTARILRG